MRKRIWGARASAVIVCWGVACFAPACSAHATYEEAIKAARVHVQANQYPVAIEDLKEAAKLAKNPRDRDQAWLDIAQGYVALEDVAHAREAWQTLLALPDVSEATKLKTFLAMGDLLKLEHEYAEERAVYEKALRELNLGGANEASRASLRMLIGETYFSAGQYARSRQEFTTLMADPKTPSSVGEMLQSRVGASYISEGNWLEGRREATKLLGQEEAALPKATAPLDQQRAVTLISAAHQQLGDSYALEKQWDKAKAEYTQALADPRLPALLRNAPEDRLKVLAVVTSSKRPDKDKTMYLTYREAMNTANTAQEANNYEDMEFLSLQGIPYADDPFKEAYARLMLANSYDGRQMYDLANTQFRQVVQSGGLGTVMTLVARLSLGQSEVLLGRYEAGRDQYVTVLDFDTTKLSDNERQTALAYKPFAHKLLARSYFLQNNYAQAKFEYEKMLKTLPLDAEQKRDIEKEVHHMAELLAAPGGAGVPPVAVPQGTAPVKP